MELTINLEIAEEVYSKARKAAELGALDTDRVERAIEYVQSGEIFTKADEYGTTIQHCGCPDFQYRAHKVAGGKCKHQIAKMILVRISENTPDTY